MTAKELAYYLVGRAWQQAGEPYRQLTAAEELAHADQAEALLRHPVVGRDITIASAYIHVHDTEIFGLVTQGEP